MKYICVGDGGYGATIVGSGETLTEAYESYADGADSLGSDVSHASACAFYLGFGKDVMVEATTIKEGA